MRTIFYNATIITQNYQKKIIPIGFVIIKESQIEKVKSGYPGTKEFDNCQNKIDCTNKIIMPGPINTHVHLGESIFGFFIKDKISLKNYLDFTDKVCILNPSLEQKRSVVSDYSMMLLIKNGTSTICGGRTANECKNWYVRNVSGYIIMRSPKLIHYCSNIMNKFSLEKRKETDMNTTAIFIHSLNRINHNKLKEISKIVKQYPKIKLIIHIMETKQSENEIIKKYKMTSIEVLQKNNLLNKNTILVHCNWANNEELKIIKKSGASIVHCLSSNLNCADKTLNLSEALKIGINTTIATDGFATNKNQNLILEAKACFTYHKLSKSKNITFQKLLDMITTNAAKALGLEKQIGSIEPGKKADILFIEQKKLTENKNCVIKNLFLYHQPKMINDLMINGKMILHNKKIIINKSEKNIYYKIKKLANKIILPS